MNGPRRCVQYTSHIQNGVIKGSVEQILDITHNMPVIIALLKNRIADRYHGSLLGIAWSLINPFLMMGAIALIFPLIMRFRVEGYVVYLLSGIIGWQFISTSISSGGISILASSSLIRKVSIPRIIFPIVYVSVELVNLLIAIVAIYALGILFSLPLNISMVWLACAVVITYAFCLGLGFLLSIMVVHFRDIQHILGVSLQAIFYLSAVIYPVQMLPVKYQYLMEFNAFYQFLRLFHSAIYGTTSIAWIHLVIPICIAVLVVILGLAVQWRFNRDLIYRI
jgi:ABC-type polysaccharide/polyol phosphate export permease